MARSHSIWVVLNDWTHFIEGAFTVKHEMITWLLKRPGLRKCVSIYRVQDGLYQFNNPQRAGSYDDFVEPLEIG